MLWTKPPVQQRVEAATKSTSNHPRQTQVPASANREGLTSPQQEPSRAHSRGRYWLRVCDPPAKRHLDGLGPLVSIVSGHHHAHAVGRDAALVLLSSPRAARFVVLHALSITPSA